jgi:hypothetical protein
VPSTIRLWQTLDDVQSFQLPRYTAVDLFEFCRKCKVAMYTAYNRDKALLAPNQLIEISFEDLTANPVLQLRNIYDRFGLHGVDDTLREAQQYFQQRGAHRKNPHRTDNQLRQLIDENWQDYMRQFGYESY